MVGKNNLYGCWAWKMELQQGGLSHKSYSPKCLQEKMGSVNFHLCLSVKR